MEIRLSQRAVWAEGQPISDLMARALASPHLISLAAGFVDPATLPLEYMQRAWEGVFSRTDAGRAALQYGSTQGHRHLRSLILEQFLEPDELGRKHPLEVDQIVVTAGSNQLLHLIADTLLDPGDIVLTTAPTYLVFLGTLNNVGARAFGVAADDQGMIPEHLQAALERLQIQGLAPRVKAIYLVPYFDNPTGANMPLDRRAAVVEIAQRWSTRHKIYVISDEAYRQLRYRGADVPSTRVVDAAGDTVIEAGTFSKSFSPGVRVGWGVIPPALVDPICHQKGNVDFGSPNLAQHLMAQVLEQDLFRPHVELLRQAYATKREAMLAACERHLSSLPQVSWRQPDGGLYVWVTLPEHVPAGPEGPLLDLALQEGVLYVPGQYCYPNEGQPVCQHTIRLSFGVQSCERIDEGVAALARSIREAMQIAAPAP